ncbi:HpcH/HpaI aldolase/citrate lyase family protein [Aeromicrobium sp. CTD01-1L150]|uniref:HpcH/HpaI aldolase family protein n=1 Tax=Aeromicrobium sp. CTD01-1L150 TaxID=3341830 RepID=UPI0035C11320
MSALHRAGADLPRPAWGAWIKLPGTESTEILALAGFDFCVVDLEHTVLDLRQVAAHITIGSSLGLRMLVRVPDHTPSTMQRLLDSGAHGVVAPHVDHPDAADHVVSASTFPPRGTRGSGATSRAGEFGHRPRAAYLAAAPLVVAQLESVAAVRAAAEISVVDGLGATLLGPADLALDPARPELETSADIAAAVVAATHAAGRLAGTACPAERAAQEAGHGFDFLVCANDSTLMASAAREVIASLRDVTGAPA